MKVALTALVIAVLATACGSGVSASGGKSADGGSASATAATVEQMSKADCLSKLGPFLNATQELKLPP